MEVVLTNDQSFCLSKETGQESRGFLMRESAQNNDLYLYKASNSELTINNQPVFIGDEAGLFERIKELAFSTQPELLATLNVDLLLEMKRSESFRRVIDSAAVRTLDGSPLVLLSRLIGLPNAQRHTGSDLLPKCAKQSANDGPAVIIIGGSEGTADKAKGNLQSKYPGSNIHVIPFPHVSTLEDPRLAEIPEHLFRYMPGVVFVCLGSPKQEFWFDNWKTLLPPGLYIGAGAAVDFAARIKIRAPKIVQSIHLEWLWRLTQEPKRLSKRYLLRGPSFISIAVRTWREAHKHD